MIVQAGVFCQRPSGEVSGFIGPEASPFFFRWWAMRSRRDIALLVMGILGISSSTALCVLEDRALEECLETAHDQECICNTIEYDLFGKCRCRTDRGEVEWKPPRGGM